MKFCKDCAHYVMLFPKSTGHKGFCKHPESDLGYDRVTGSHYGWHSAEIMRERNAACGPLAKLYSQVPERVSLMGRFFKMLEK